MCIIGLCDFLTGLTCVLRVLCGVTGASPRDLKPFEKLPQAYLQGSIGISTRE